MKKIYILIFGILFGYYVSAHTFIEGKNFYKIKPSIRTSPKIVVFFSFFCSNCYILEKNYQFSSKIKTTTLGKYLKYFNADFLNGNLGYSLTKAWSIAIALNIEKKIILPIFLGIQKNHTIYDNNSLKKVFLSASGITSKTYDSFWNSFLITTILLKQIQIIKLIHLKETPTILIKKKYIINNQSILNNSMKNFVIENINLINFINKKMI